MGETLQPRLFYSDRMATGAGFGGPENCFRYVLWRHWDALPRVTFIGLNPSTADENTDDPTIRRMIGFAKSWGCGGIYVVNLFAFRSTDPKDMKAAADPVGGPDTDRLILKHCQESARVVACWGAHGGYLSRSAAVTKLLQSAGVRIQCFGTTGSGEPKHPLYLSATTELVNFV